LKKWSKTDKRGVQRALELPFFRGVLAKQEAKIAFRKSEQKSIRGGLTGVYPRFSKSLFCSLF
jgi:hypothetical protein